MLFWGWDWDWGWSWLAGIGVALALGIFILPWFFFLLNLHNLLERVSYENRAMAPAHVWLNFVPLFCLGWFLYTVVKIKDSLQAEYAARRWAGPGDAVYSLGLAAGVLWIASFFLWWAPFLGWLCAVGWLVCWIMYWIKTSEIKGALAVGPGVPGVRVPLRRTGKSEDYGEGAGKDVREDTCAYCGTPFNPGDRFCRSCGLRLPGREGSGREG